MPLEGQDRNEAGNAQVISLDNASSGYQDFDKRAATRFVRYQTYRVYRYAETDVTIPLTVPGGVDNPVVDGLPMNLP